jgi:hypothetical protein
MYFLLIRPQQKRAKAHKALLGALKVGDEIVTNGGIEYFCQPAGDFLTPQPKFCLLPNLNHSKYGVVPACWFLDFSILTVKKIEEICPQDQLKKKPI